MKISPAEDHVQLKMLVVDDTKANQNLLRAALMRDGHEVIIASSGEEAIELYQSEHPDAILMDVMMPGIGGIEATRRIRALNSDQWTPIIFISALGHRDDMVRGLEAGGDDYLAKPVDLQLLRAKIEAMQRIASLERKLQQTNVELKNYQSRSEHELEIARDLINHMIHKSSHPVPGVALWIHPASNLSGDMLITQDDKKGRSFVMLADAMGHGLPAAIPLMPLVQVFSTMTLRGFGVSEIVSEMNARIKNLLPVGNFVAITLIGIDRKQNQITVWNGGNPEALLLDTAGKVVQRFPSCHPALGILRDDRFDDTSVIHRIDQPGTLILYSDGLTDARNAQGQEFGSDRVLQALRNDANHQRAIQESVLEHLNGVEANDDISVATITLA